MTAPYSPPLDLFTTAVLQMLRDGHRVVFDGAYTADPELAQQNPAYAANPAKPVYPYDLLYPVPGGSSDPIPDLDLDLRTVTVAYQVTSVSNLRNQCQHAARVVRDRMVARTPVGSWAHQLVLPDGWQCIDRRPDPAMPGVDRAGEHPNAVFTCPARYLLTFTPA